jgi:hypothetical protein
MNDVLVDAGLKELKKSLKDIKKEKVSEFDDLVRVILSKYGNRFSRFEQTKSKDQIEFRFTGEFED